MSPPGSMMTSTAEIPITSKANNISQDNISVEFLEKLKIEEEDESKFVGEIEFDLGVIDSPIYGVAHIKGTLPLVSKLGTYSSAWKEGTEDEAFIIISSWLNKHKLNLGHKVKRDGMIRNGIRSVMLTFPPRELNPRLIAAICLNIVALYMDDIEEDTGIVSEFGGMPINSNGDGLMETFYGILRGKYQNFSDVPKIGFPMLKPILWFTFLAYEQLSSIPDYDPSQLDHFIKAVSECYKASLILANPEFVDKCSEQLFSEIRQYDVGAGTSIEFAYFCEAIQISKEDRSDLIFKSCLTIGRKMAILINDLLGLKKDIHLERPINVILRNVRQNGISLIDGVAQAIAKIKSMTQDMILGLDLLGEQRSEFEEFAKCTKFVMDGHFFQYELSDNKDESKAKKRWGKPIIKRIYF